MKRNRTWFGVVVTDDFDVSPIARTSGVSHEDAIEGRVANPEAGQSDSHNHGYVRLVKWPSQRQGENVLTNGGVSTDEFFYRRNSAPRRLGAWRR